MLLKYFIKRFFAVFVGALLVLVPLFSSCDVVVRLASVPFSLQILKLFWFMLPLVALFAIPIATCLATAITTGSLFAKDELLLFQFFPSARKKLELAVVFFSVVLLVIYIPLVFTWAPNGYWRGKNFLINAVQQQIKNLPEKSFHHIASRATIYFRKKTILSKELVCFDELLLMVREKNNKQYLVSSHFGELRRGILILFDGSIWNQTANNTYLASFKSLEIDFDRMFFSKEEGSSFKPTKFLTWQELCESSKENLIVWKEKHKRLVQILWQLLLPLLIFLAVMILGRHKSNILLSVILSGSFFLFSYISLNMAYVFLQRSYGSLLLFYSIPLFLGLILFYFYRKRWC